MSNKTASPKSPVSLLPDELRALIQHDREQTLADWQRLHSPATLTTAQAAVRCGRVRADGTPNIPAFKMFLARHADLPRKKAGRRLVRNPPRPAAAARRHAMTQPLRSDGLS